MTEMNVNFMQVGKVVPLENQAFKFCPHCGKEILKTQFVPTYPEPLEPFYPPTQSAPLPNTNYPWAKNIIVNRTNLDSEQPCAFDSFMKSNPNHTGPMMLSCTCPKCTPRC